MLLVEGVYIAVSHSFLALQSGSLKNLRAIVQAQDATALRVTKCNKLLSNDQRAFSEAASMKRGFT